MNQDPTFIIFTGPMFGSKTTKMLAVIDRYRYQQKKVLAFKPQIDDRYSESAIVTHSGGNLAAICVKKGADVVEYVHKMRERLDVIAVDEAFMIPGIAESLIQLFKEGHTIVVSSLQLSASGLAFEEVRDIMPWATKIEVCPAVCPATGSGGGGTEFDEIGCIGSPSFRRLFLTLYIVCSASSSSSDSRVYSSLTFSTTALSQ